MDNDDFDKHPIVQYLRWQLDRKATAMCMDAYYYVFEPTGVREVDELLSAVACAGKAYHHTEGWNDETPSYGDHCVGNTPVEWIQNAANRAAAAFKEQSDE